MVERSALRRMNRLLGIFAHSPFSLGGVVRDVENVVVSADFNLPVAPIPRVKHRRDYIPFAAVLRKVHLISGPMAGPGSFRILPI